MRRRGKISAMALCVVFMANLLPLNVGAWVGDEGWNGAPYEITTAGEHEFDGEKGPYKINADGEVSLIFSESCRLDAGTARDVTPIDIQQAGKVNLILKDGVEIVLKGSSGNSGIKIGGVETTITCEHYDEEGHECGTGCGSLYVYGGEGASAIHSDGALTISGGNISAGGGEEGAGIYSEGDFTVSGGNVEAYGGYNASGIGGMFEQHNLYIKGGNISAYGTEQKDSLIYDRDSTVNAVGAGIHLESGGKGEYIACEYGYLSVKYDGSDTFPEDVVNSSEGWQLWQSELLIGTKHTTESLAVTSSHTMRDISRNDYNYFQCKTIRAAAIIKYEEELIGTLVPDRDMEDFAYISPTPEGRFVFSEAGDYSVENLDKSTPSEYGIDVTAKSGVVNIELNGVNIDLGEKSGAAAVNITGGCTTNITIKEGTENTMESGEEAAGIQNGTNKLNIACERAGGNHVCDARCGVLTVNGGAGGAGIGGGVNKAGGNITINMSKVTATGGFHAAGIGGGSDAGGENIAISGGVVTAKGGNSASALGGGYQGNSVNVSITPEAVSAIYAKAGDSGADTPLDGSPFTAETDITSQVDGVQHFESLYMSGALRFETNGGTINEEILDIYYYGKSVPLPVNVSKKHNSFMGWYDNPEFEGEAITEISADDTGDKTYYAKWLELSADVFFETYGGTINDYAFDEYDYGYATVLPSDVTKENAVFAGWYNNPEFEGEAITEISADDTGNKTYYARWLGDLDLDGNGYYMIFTGDGLAGFANLVNSGNTDIKGILMADVDMGGKGIATVGNETNKFSGIFDGAGHAITNICINAQDSYGGLFGYISNATVKDIHISGEMTIDGAGKDMVRFGTIGYADGESTISGIHSELDIAISNAASVKQIGGILGRGDGTAKISRCTYEGTISTGNMNVDCIGGIVSYSVADSAIDISDCAFYGSINSSCEDAFNIGGIMGYYNCEQTYGANISLKNCVSAGTITAANTSKAGAVMGIIKGITSDYAGNISNNYFKSTLDGIGELPEHLSSAVIPADDDSLKSGEIAYKLGSAWGQDIGTDEHPVVGGKAIYYQDDTYSNEYVLDFEISSYGHNVTKTTAIVKIPESREYTIVFADYNEDGSLNMADTITQHFKYGSTPITSSADILLGNNDKIMIWDGFESMKPKNNAFTIQKGEGVSAKNGGKEDLFDGDLTTKFQGHYSAENLPEVVFKYEKPVCMESYTLTTADDTAHNSGRNWTSWTLCGSDSPDGPWSTIHKVKDAALPRESYAGSEQFVIENNTTPYQYYKLTINSIVSGNFHQMAEFNAVVK